MDENNQQSEEGSGQAPKETLPANNNGRSQLAYPMDLASKSVLKLALEEVLKDVILRRNRVQFTIPKTTNTSFAVASSYMVITGVGATTISTIIGGREGMILVLQFTDANITISDNTYATTADTDKINLSAAFTSTADDILQLLHDGKSWREVSRSIN